MERSYGSFLRSLAIPYDVDPEKISAGFKNGVLEVTPPKPATVQAKTRKIPLKKAVPPENSVRHFGARCSDSLIRVARTRTGYCLQGR